MSAFPEPKQFSGRGGGQSNDTRSRQRPRRKQAQNTQNTQNSRQPSSNDSPKVHEYAGKGKSALLTKVNSSQSSQPLLYWHTDAHADSWDSSNQKKMTLMEQMQQQTGSNIQELYKKFQQMRETERAEMEKRGLVDRPDARKSLTAALKFIGTCPDMCPVFERVRRIVENNVMPLEKGENKRKVKAFSRPAAGQPPPLPSDVRPPSVLKESLLYLVQVALPQLPSSHAFLWDRTRSIRQDFTYQNYAGDEAVWCHEVIARIHLVSIARMSAAISEPGSEIEWSQQQEREQLNKCLQSLSEFYNLARAKQVPRPNEAEFRAYELLSHLWDSERSAAIDRLPPSVRDHELVKLARSLRALVTGSAPLARAFLVKANDSAVPPLIRCSLIAHVDRVRRLACGELSRSLHHRSGMYPFHRFTKLLALRDDVETQRFCDHYDLNVSTSDVNNVEVDMKTWNNQTTADKMAFTPLLPPALLNTLNSLSVVSSSPDSSGSSVRPLIQPREPHSVWPAPSQEPRKTLPQQPQNPVVPQLGFQFSQKQPAVSTPPPVAPKLFEEVPNETQDKPTGLFPKSQSVPQSLPQSLPKLPHLQTKAPPSIISPPKVEPVQKPAIPSHPGSILSFKTPTPEPPKKLETVPQRDEAKERQQLREAQRKKFIDSCCQKLCADLIEDVVRTDIEREVAAGSLYRKYLQKAAWIRVSESIARLEQERQQQEQMEIDAIHADAELHSLALARRPRTRSRSEAYTPIPFESEFSIQTLAKRAASHGLKSLCVIGMTLGEWTVRLATLIEAEGVSVEFTDTPPSLAPIADITVDVSSDTEAAALAAIQDALENYRPPLPEPQQEHKLDNNEVQHTSKRLRPNDRRRYETLRSSLRPSLRSRHSHLNTRGNLSFSFHEPSFGGLSRSHSFGTSSIADSMDISRAGDEISPEVAKLRKLIAEVNSTL